MTKTTEDGDLDWLSQIKERAKEKEPVKEEVVAKEPESELSGYIAKKCLLVMLEKMGDKNFVMSESLHFPTCEKLLNMFNLLIENGGEWVTGNKTIDGFHIQCPIHAYAPMYMCYECPHWKGKKNPEGKCTRSPEDIDYEAEKYSNLKAQEMEIANRRERSKLATKEGA